MYGLVDEGHLRLFVDGGNGLELFFFEIVFVVGLDDMDQVGNDSLDVFGDDFD